MMENTNIGDIHAIANYSCIYHNHPNLHSSIALQKAQAMADT